MPGSSIVAVYCSVSLSSSVNRSVIVIRLARAAAAVAADAGHPIEILRHDDQRVALPVSARVAHVGLDARREMRPAVERDDARLVDHLVADDDEARRLHDLVAVVVDGRQERSHDAARDAAVVEAAIEIAVRLAPLEPLAPRRASACCCA